MTPLTAIKTCLAKSFQFSGRASRAEFWWFAPLGLAFPALVGGWGFSLARELPSLVLLLVAVLLALIPLSAAGVRRFHDVGSSGALFFAGVVPAIFVMAAMLIILIGLFALVTIIYAKLGIILIGFGGTIVFLTAFVGPGLVRTLVKLNAPSNTLPNRYGPNPLEAPK